MSWSKHTCQNQGFSPIVTSMFEAYDHWKYCPFLCPLSNFSQRFSLWKGQWQSAIQYTQKFEFLYSFLVIRSSLVTDSLSLTQSKEHSPGMRKVLGSNPSRPLSHFFLPFGDASHFSFFKKNVHCCMKLTPWHVYLSFLAISVSLFPFFPFVVA